MKKIIIKAFIDENQELQTQVLKSNTESIPIFTLSDDFTITANFGSENMEDRLFVETIQKENYLSNGFLVVPALTINDVDGLFAYNYYKNGIKENLITTGHIVVFRIEIENYL